MKMEKYKIAIHFSNNKTITFNVDDYEYIENGLIKFFDKKYNKIKIFDSRLCEIEVRENE